MIKQNRLVSGVLVLALVVVWGAVVFRVMNAVDDSASRETSTPSAPQAERPAPFEYTPDARDPFAAPTRSQPRGSESRDEERWTPPPFTLTGILTKDRITLAVLERIDGTVFLLQERDTLEGVEILRVDGQRVEYSYGKRRGAWTLERP
jgi:hypothetical protein